MRCAKLIHSYKHIGAFAIILCALPGAVLAQPAPAQKSPEPLGKLVDVGGYRVHLYCTGVGSPAVVIVGAAFSFDWGLVQPEVAKSTQVCSYDHSGIGWSDSGPRDSCSLRVGEIHTALKNAGIKGPYILVGHSLGALVARLYAAQYPDEVAGIIFAEHAFAPGVVGVPTPPLPSGTPHISSFGLESDPNFNRLSARDRELHAWAMAQSRNQIALQTNPQIMPQCVADADAALRERPYPLGDKPLIDVSTSMGSGQGLLSKEYAELQTRLLTLSRNSRQVIAENSGHFIIIDRPDVVVECINRVVGAYRSGAKL